MRSSARARSALFLDRDGVLLREVDHLGKVSDAAFLPGVVKALRAVPPSMRIVILSNQAGIAKGLYGLRDYYRVQRWVVDRLCCGGVRVDRSYFCPHHPAGVVRRYRQRCQCRKPGTLLYRRAARDLNLNLRRSWSVGDKTSDILAGKRAGTRTVLVRTGYAGRDRLYRVHPTFRAQNLFDAVRLIRSETTHGPSGFILGRIEDHEI